MRALGIKEGELSIVFHPQQSEHGLEQIEFHVRTNKSFDAGPLNRSHLVGNEPASILLFRLLLLSEASCRA